MVEPSIEEAVSRRFAAVAQNGPSGLFAYPTGESGLALLGYAPELLRAVPSAIREGFCGVGNVQKQAFLRAGDTVLDIGCGSGLDLLCAAHRVAPHGRAIGLDSCSGMLDRLRSCALPPQTGTMPDVRADDPISLGLVHASAQALPLPNASFDCVLSNGVFNLVRDKARAVAELFRVLKPGGRLVLADQFRNPCSTGRSRVTERMPVPSPPSPGGWAL